MRPFSEGALFASLPLMKPAAPPAPNDTYPARIRLRWRARRGLLENDILLTRFLDTYETTLSDEEVRVFEQLLDLSDNDLMALLLERTEPDSLSIDAALLANPAFKACLTKLRTA